MFQPLKIVAVTVLLDHPSPYICYLVKMPCAYNAYPLTVKGGKHLTQAGSTIDYHHDHKAPTGEDEDLVMKLADVVISCNDGDGYLCNENNYKF